MTALPDEAITLSGGCACQAIRYTLKIPAKDDRTILFPADESKGQSAIHYPLMLICHCNDCRIATTGVSNPATMCPMAWTTFSFLRRDSKKGEEEERMEVSDTLDIVLNKETYVGNKTYLSCYQSPKKKPVSRWFCSRCGGNAGYTYYPLPTKEFVPSWDFYLGSLDRKDLERVRVSAHVWWDYGIEWVQHWQTEGDHMILNLNGNHLPRHSTINMREIAHGWGSKAP